MEHTKRQMSQPWVMVNGFMIDDGALHSYQRLILQRIAPNCAVIGGSERWYEAIEPNSLRIIYLPAQGVELGLNDFSTL